uniref:Transposase n=1 Tax=Ditylenchus dipsaci TaxID=166011 RepID=A0A915DJQ3_9BILA
MKRLPKKCQPNGRSRPDGPEDRLLSRRYKIEEVVLACVAQRLDMSVQNAWQCYNEQEGAEKTGTLEFKTFYRK